MSVKPPHAYRLTTLRSRSERPPATSTGVRMLGAPEVGVPMVLYQGDGERRIVTSPVVRVFKDATLRGTYVETANTVYLLQEARRGRYPRRSYPAIQARSRGSDVG